MDRLSKQEIEKLRDSKYPWAQLTKMIHGLPSNSDAPDDAIRYLCDLALQSLSKEAVRDEALEERFWVVEAVNEDDTVLSPPAYWYGGFVGSTVAGHVGSDIHAICTRFLNAQTAEYVKCLLRNAKIPPDRGHHWKIFKHVIALKREPNAAATALEGWQKAIREELTPAPAAPVAEMVRRLRKHCEMIGHSSSGHETALHTRNADAAEAALLEKLGQGWIPEPVAWRREWDGDVSDIGNMLYASSRDELDEPLSRWQPLYAREPGASDD